MKPVPSFLSILFVATLPVALRAGDQFQLTMHAGKASGQDVPVSVTLPIDADKIGRLGVGVHPVGKSDRATSGQLHRDGDKVRLSWIVPELKAGSTTQWAVRISEGRSDSRGFEFNVVRGSHTDLAWGDRVLTRYMSARDASNDKRAHETYKVYHHVLDGDKIITKGAGGKYTHHRGLYIGFSRMKVEGVGQFDTWHMKNVTQEHQRFTALEAGKVFGQSTVLVHWKGPKGDTLVEERRTTTVYRQSGSTLLLIDFESQLKPVAGDTFFNGDPEHAGMQYRPANQVAELAGKRKGTEAATKYLFHATGIDPKKDHDLPWAAMAYTLDDKRYSVQHMNHPDNPKGTIYSAYRDYGRFGAFPKKTVAQGDTWTLRYRIYVAPGPLPSRESMQARWEAFANPPRVELTK